MKPAGNWFENSLRQAGPFPTGLMQQSSTKRRARCGDVWTLLTWAASTCRLRVQRRTSPASTPAAARTAFHYRVVDEYDGDTLSVKNARTSTRLLTLGELETFFNRAWSIFEVLEMNFGYDGYDLDRMLRFVVGVESQFYPQIGELYERRIEAWAAATKKRSWAWIRRKNRKPQIADRHRPAARATSKRCDTERNRTFGHDRSPYRKPHRISALGHTENT